MTAVLVGVLGSQLSAPSGPQPWVWPVSGTRVVLRPFDPPATRYGPGHRGADVAAAVGAPIRAAGAGRVSYAGLLAGRGVVVVVHGDLRTTYEPVTATVRVGQLVVGGEPLGRLAAGSHCGGTPCLHWGLLRGEVYLDPVQLVARGPSRLLPVGGPGTGATAAALPVPARPSPPPVARPAPEPAFSLRADEAPWGAAAVLALLAGLALLRPSRRPPTTPVAPALVSEPVAGEPGLLVDLVTERARRRA